jgi:hypothetical protein
MMNENSNFKRKKNNIMQFRKIPKIIFRSLILIGIIFGLFGNTLAQVTSPLWDYPIDLTQASSSTNAIDPIILCDQYQNTHILWGDRDEMPALYYMNDVSGEWSAPIDVIANINNTTLMMRLSGVIQDNPDFLHVLWVDEYLSAVLNYSRVALSEASDPRAWKHPLPIAFGIQNGSIDVDGNGILHVVYGVSGADYPEVLINYIYSDDYGDTWSTPVKILSKKVPVPSDSTAFIDVDDKMRIHVGISIRSQNYGEYSEVGYLQSINGGSSWGDYRLIDDIGTAYQGVNLLTPYSFEGDEIHLTWHDPRRMHQWSQDGGLTWSDPKEIMPLGAAFGGSNGLTKDNQGTIHVVTAENRGVFSANWDGSRWGVPERIEDRLFDPHGQNITICQGNKLQVVYDDRSNTQNIWYSYKIVNSPHINQQVIGTSTEIQKVDPNKNSDTENIEEAQFESDNTEFIGEVDLRNLPIDEQVLANPIIPILIASLLVTVLILVVSIIRRKLI